MSSLTRRRHLLTIAALLVALLTVAFAPAFQSTAIAQDAPAAGEPAPAAAPAAETTTAKKKSFLSWMIRASGWYGLVLLILSFIMVAVIMMNVLQVRRDVLMPPDFIELFEEKINAKDYQAAYEVSRADDSFIARVLTNGLSKLNRGYEEAIEGMQEIGEEENMTLEHRISYLALIGAIAPMIGLMGTVAGMIESFQTIATSTTSPKPADLAEGISKALFTTLEGLIVAIPAMIGYSLLRNQVAKLVLEVGIVSEGLMSKLPMAAGGKKGGGAPAPAPAAPEKSN
ncbi:MAG TPA: MotA/TolQ/ExbB proton channel family protein [Planctomycetaceae bacterium]|nr:MotA/TolQ/ExbB proton channel family protein [Planctomycetaceae bacterium]